MRLEMTDRKHLKTRVRARMARTGERYAAARTHVVAAGQADPAETAPDGILHLAGADAETTGLRILLAAAGIRDADGRPLPDPTALVIGGGIGLGVFSFHYAKEGFSSFYLAGRHRWDDAVAYLAGAAERLGRTLDTAESTAAAPAERRLRAALEHGPAIVWVDLLELGTRAGPIELSGGGYHTLVVQRIDDDADEAIVSDLSRTPIRIPLGTLARARGRIAKQKHRVAWLAGREDGHAAAPDPDLPAAIRAGLAATVAGFDRPRTRNFSLAALGDWANRLRGGSADSWARIFAPGEWRWVGLSAIHDGIEHGGSGGGLVRPRFAAGLRDAVERTGNRGLLDPADRYEALGREWSALATAALPDEVPLLRLTRQAQDRRAAAYASSGGTVDGRADPAVVAAWEELVALRAEAREAAPLDERTAAEHLAGLAERVDAIRVAEIAALDALRGALG